MSARKLYRPVLEYTRECGKDKQREITSSALYIHTLSFHDKLEKKGNRDVCLVLSLILT